MKQNNVDNNHKKYGLWLAAAVFLVWLFVSGSGFFIIGSQTSLGLLGDSFGLINSLFSGLALAGIVYTIYLQTEQLKIQSEDLEHQREELQETRLVLKEQHKEFNEQNKTLRLQRFENTLFNMVSVFNQIVNDIRFAKGNEAEIRGRPALNEIYGKMLVDAGNMRDKRDSQKIYLDYYKTYSSQLAHYYRCLYGIFKFISENKFLESDEERIHYAKILRSQLSDQEILLLFYNVAVSGKGDKFLKYAESYELFNNIDENKFLYKEDGRKMVKQAFGDKKLDNLPERTEPK